MPPYQIVKIFLNGLTRQVATHNKTLIRPHMDEKKITLESGHPITNRGTPPL
jgi:hypothetical protein